MTRFAIAILALVAFAGAATAALAAEANWKLGRVYYRGVCTKCHNATKGEPISPDNYTVAEWTAYIDADKHNKGADTVKQYVSTDYRASIKADNKVAAKFAEIPDADML
jgi:cytochrome c5